MRKPNEVFGTTESWSFKKIKISWNNFSTFLMNFYLKYHASSSYLELDVINNILLYKLHWADSAFGNLPLNVVRWLLSRISPRKHDTASEASQAIMVSGWRSQSAANEGRNKNNIAFTCFEYFSFLFQTSFSCSLLCILIFTLNKSTSYSRNCDKDFFFLVFLLLSMPVWMPFQFGIFLSSRFLKDRIIFLLNSNGIIFVV